MIVTPIERESRLLLVLVVVTCSAAYQYNSSTDPTDYSDWCTGETCRINIEL